MTTVQAADSLTWRAHPLLRSRQACIQVEAAIRDKRAVDQQREASLEQAMGMSPLTARLEASGAEGWPNVESLEPPPRPAAVLVRGVNAQAGAAVQVGSGDGLSRLSRMRN
jgi:hypothetical protein